MTDSGASTDLLLAIAAATTALAILLLVVGGFELIWRWTVRRRLRRFARSRSDIDLDRKAPSVFEIAAVVGRSIVSGLGDAGVTLRAGAQLRIEQAGEPAGLTAEHLIGFRVLGAVTAVAADTALFLLTGGGPLVYVLMAVLTLMLVFGLDLALSNRAGARRAEVERELPALVDMVALCLAAGMGFDSAMAAITERMSGTLAYEIRRYLRAMSELGQRRREAFDNMIRRVPSSDLAHFADTVVEALETGSGLLTAITSQATLLRQTRRRRAEAAAQRAPVRMVIPMTLFVLPVLMLVVMGPVALRLIRTIR